MPSVPTYDAPNVAEQGLPNVDQRVGAGESPEAFGAVQARTIQQVGTGLMQVGSSMVDAQIRLQEQADADLLFQVENSAKEKTLNFQNAIQEYRGQNAWGISQKAARQAADIESESVYALPTDRLKKVFKQRYAAQRLTLLNQAAEWESGQRQKALIGQADASMSKSSSIAIGAVGTATEAHALETAASDIRNSIGFLQESQGLSPAEAGALTTKQLDYLHSNVIQRKIDSGNVAGARDYFLTARVEMSGGTVAAVEQALKAGNDKTRAQDNRDRLLAESKGDFQAALQKARATLSGDEEDLTVRFLKEQRSEVAQQAEQAQKALSDRAWKQFYDAGGKVSAIQSSVMAGLDGATRHAIYEEADQRRRQREGKVEPRKTDPEAWADLWKLSVDNPEQFKALDLRKYIPKLSESDFEMFVKRQTAPPEEGPELLTLNRQLRIAHDQLGLKAKKKHGEFDAFVVRELEQATLDKGKPLTFQERQEIINRAMLPGMVEQTFLPDLKKRVFELRPSEGKKFRPGVDGDRDGARAALLKRGVVKPTDEQIDEEVTKGYVGRGQTKRPTGEEAQAPAEKKLTRDDKASRERVRSELMKAGIAKPTEADIDGFFAWRDQRER